MKSVRNRMRTLPMMTAKPEPVEMGGDSFLWRAATAMWRQICEEK